MHEVTTYKGKGDRVRLRAAVDYVCELTLDGASWCSYRERRQERSCEDGEEHHKSCGGDVKRAKLWLQRNPARLYSPHICFIEIGYSKAGQMGFGHMSIIAVQASSSSPCSERVDVGWTVPKVWAPSPCWINTASSKTRAVYCLGELQRERSRERKMFTADSSEDGK